MPAFLLPAPSAIAAQIGASFSTITDCASRPRLSGNGTLELANGRFADKQSGVDLRDATPRIAFRDDAARG